MGASDSNTLSASRSRSATNNWQTTDSTGSQTPTFDSSEAKSVLAALTGNASNGDASNYITNAGSVYNNAGQTGSAVPNYQQNPYITALIQGQKGLAESQFQQGEAGIRAGQYRGGTNANANMQGNYAGNFGNQLGSNIAQEQLGQYNTANTTALTGASGEGSLGQGQQSLATQLLALLRGQSTTANQTTSGGTSGTQSSTGVSNTGKISFGTG